LDYRTTCSAQPLFSDSGKPKQKSQVLNVRMPTAWAGTRVLKDYLQTCLMLIFPFGYSFFVVMLALYLQVAFDLAGTITVVTAVVPVVAVWAKIMLRREAESVQGRTEGFQTSPERQSKVLGEYVQLVRDKGEELTVPRDTWTSVVVGSNTLYFRFSGQIDLSDGRQQLCPSLGAIEGAKYKWHEMEIIVSKVHADDVVLLIKKEKVLIPNNH
jgi:hypothetical protein